MRNKLTGVRKSENLPEFPDFSYHSVNWGVKDYSGITLLP